MRVYIKDEMNRKNSRVDKVAHLLKNTDRTNLEICFEVGFQSPSNYYKVFRHQDVGASKP
jgi:transcriptional regulator GlxA family with amidase domain